MADAFHQLTRQDARIIRALLAAGMMQHDVAAVFGVNPGRVAEIATGERFNGEPPADLGDRDNRARALLLMHGATRQRRIALLDAMRGTVHAP